MSKLARFISILFHPVFATTYMLAFVLFQKNTYLYYTINEKGRWVFLVISVVVTVLAPLVSVGYLIFTNQVKNVFIENRKERFIPMGITLAYGYGLYYLFLRFELPSSLLAVTSVGVVLIGFSLIITLFWKISAHMMAVSGFGGMLLAFSQKIHPISPELIAVLFILMGIIAWARMHQGSHTLGQILAGWVLGFPIAYLTMLLVIT